MTKEELRALPPQRRRLNEKTEAAAAAAGHFQAIVRFPPLAKAWLRRRLANAMGRRPGMKSHAMGRMSDIPTKRRRVNQRSKSGKVKLKSAAANRRP